MIPVNDSKAEQLLKYVDPVAKLFSRSQNHILKKPYRTRLFLVAPAYEGRAISRTIKLRGQPEIEFVNWLEFLFTLFKKNNVIPELESAREIRDFLKRDDF